MWLTRWMHRAGRDGRGEAQDTARDATPNATRPGQMPVEADALDRTIVMYTTTWCADCRRAKRVFTKLGVPYTEINIEHDDAAAALVQRLNSGMRSVPTILFPDGTRLVEPSSRELEETLRACCVSAT